jgi:hypothetical protein
LTRTLRFITFAILIALCAATAFLGASCKRPPKPEPSPASDKNGGSRVPAELAPPDDVAICVWDDAALLELDMEWPPPYDWQALVFRNLQGAGAVVVAPLFSLDSPRPDPEGGERLARVIGALAGAATATFVVLPAEPPAAILHHWPPLALRNDDVSARWGAIYPALPEGEESVRYGVLLSSDQEQQDNLSVEAAAAAAFLGLDERLLRDAWTRMASQAEPFLELPFGKKNIPAAQTGGYYAFGIRPYPLKDGFPEFSCRDALLMNLDPSPVAAPIPRGESRPPNADMFYWLRDVQTGAYPPRVLGSFTINGIAPTSALTLYDKDRPAQLLIGGIDRNDKSGAMVVFPLDNPEAETLDGAIQSLNFIPLAMALSRDRKSISVLDGKSKSMLTVDGKTLKQVRAYPLKEEYKLLADPGPYAADVVGVPTYPIQMAVSPATDTAYLLVPYTDSILRFDPFATPAITLNKLPEKAFHMELTDDAQYIYLLGGEGRVLSGRTSNMKFFQMNFPDTVAWTAPAAFHFRGLSESAAAASAPASARPASKATASTAVPARPAVTDYRSLFTIDAQSKSIFAIDSAGETKPLRLYASPAQIRPDIAQGETIAIEPVTLIHTPTDTRLFVLMRVTKDTTGTLPPHLLGIIDPYSRNWLTTVAPVNLSGIITPFVAGDLIVLVAAGDAGLNGVVVDTGASLRGLRHDMAGALAGKAVLVTRDFSGFAPHRAMFGVDSDNTWPPHQISATIIQNLINGDFAPVR